MAEKFTDYVIADLNLADWGRKEIRIAETEMPGLMAIREEFAAAPALAQQDPSGEGKASKEAEIADAVDDERLQLGMGWRQAGLGDAP